LAPEVKDHEPHLALDGGRDGLDLYRILIALLPRILVPEGGFFAEIGDGQAPAMRSLLEEAGFVRMAVFPDLAGKERVVFASRPEERS
jgi:release factor glutamine methyltransferase